MRTVEEINADIEWADHHHKYHMMERYQNELCAALTDGIPLDRLEALCAAEREGRAVVLPCKVGDTVWMVAGCIIEARQIYSVRVMSRDTAPEFSARFFACPSPIYGDEEIDDEDFWDSDIGTTIFLTREAAEAAQKGGAR
jgi:hypothetical protein